MNWQLKYERLWRVLLEVHKIDIGNSNKLNIYESVIKNELFINLQEDTEHEKPATKKVSFYRDRYPTIEKRVAYLEEQMGVTNVKSKD